MDLVTETIFEESLYKLPEKTWVILSKPWKEIGTDERALLQKILGAVGKSIDSVILKYQPVLNLGEWPNTPSRVLYFGDAVKGLSQNEVITVEDSSVILTSSLSELQGDAAAKQKLWQALKQLYKA
jgi:DNA polymerase III psi subunit